MTQGSTGSEEGTKIGWSSLIVRKERWISLIVRKESLHNNGKQWASGTKGNIILLDNGSTLSLFGNPDMVKNIRESKTTLELGANAGTKTTK
jgi:hypothetical protein